MKNKKFSKAGVGFIAIFAISLMATGLIMTACKSTVNPASAGIATVTKTPVPPTATTTPTSTPSNVTINVGDVSLIGMITSSGDQFAFVCLNQIPANAQINFTNTPWDAAGVSFVTGGTNRGTITWAPTSNVPQYTEIYVYAGTSGAATMVGSTSNTLASGFSGTFTLKTGEDQIYVYQGTASNPTFISAMGVFNSGTNVWTQPGAWHTGGLPPASPPTTGSYGELPAGLQGGAGTSIVFNSNNTSSAAAGGVTLTREWVYQCNDTNAGDTETNLINDINTAAPVSYYLPTGSPVGWTIYSTAIGESGAYPVSVTVGNSMGTTLAGASTAFPTTGIPLCIGSYTW